MGQHVTLSIQVFAGSLFPFRSNPIRISEKKKCDSHCWHSHCCRTFFAPMSHRTAGIRTFDIRTLVSFALLTPSHCWHSHCWLRTGVVRTSVFRTLVVQAKGSKRIHRGGGGGGSPLPMNPLEVSSFVSKSTECALTACEHVFTIDPCFIACNIHSTFKELIVAERARPCSSGSRRVTDCAVMS